MKKLGNNPLEKKRESFRHPLISKSKTEPASESEWKECIHLKRSKDKFYCGSRSSRNRGFLGNESEAKEKCERCHVKEIK